MNIIKGIKTEPVNSSNIKEIGYDEKSQTCQVNFWNGAIYQYHPVDIPTYHGLKYTDSVGKYFNANLSTNKSITHIRVRESNKRK